MFLFSSVHFRSFSYAVREVLDCSVRGTNHRNQRNHRNETSHLKRTNHKRVKNRKLKILKSKFQYSIHRTIVQIWTVLLRRVPQRKRNQVSRNLTNTLTQKEAPLVLNPSSKADSVMIRSLFLTKNRGPSMKIKVLLQEKPDWPSTTLPVKIRKLQKVQRSVKLQKILVSLKRQASITFSLLH